MTALVALFNAIASIPAIIQGFTTLVSWLEEKFGPDWLARVEDLHSASLQWQAAQTETERMNAVKAMALAFNSTK